MAKRLGFITPERYFPTVGDILQDVVDGITWECMRTHKFTDPVTGQITEYCFFMGRQGDEEPQPLVWIRGETNIPEFLKMCDTIIRFSKGMRKAFKKNANGNYQGQTPTPYPT